MNLSREKLVQVERNLVATVADNARTRAACADALRILDRELGALKAEFQFDVLRLGLAIESLGARVALLERPWPVKLRAWMRDRWARVRAQGAV